MIAIPQINVPSDAPEWARSMAATTNNALQIIVAAQNRTYATVYVPCTSPTTANQSFTVNHSLNAIPKMVSSLPQSNATIYATTEDKKEWSKTSVRVRCTSADTVLILKVEA